SRQGKWMIRRVARHPELKPRPQNRITSQGADHRSPHTGAGPETMNQEHGNLPGLVGINGVNLSLAGLKRAIDAASGDCLALAWQAHHQDERNSSLDTLGDQPREPRGTCHGEGPSALLANEKAFAFLSAGAHGRIQ